MPTENLGLPTISGNMTADVVRDMNALAEAVDAAAGADGSLASKSDLSAFDVKLDDINQGVDEINTKSDQIKQGVDEVNTKVTALGSKAVNGIARFDTPGTYTWTAPEGVKFIKLTMFGGGGAGGGLDANTSGTGAGAGGGGGAFVIDHVVSVVPGQTYSLVVGAGGVPVNGSVGGNGGTSTAFGVTCFGGSGGSAYINSGTPPVTRGGIGSGLASDGAYGGSGTPYVTNASVVFLLGGNTPKAVGGWSTFEQSGYAVGGGGGAGYSYGGRGGSNGGGYSGGWGAGGGGAGNKGGTAKYAGGNGGPGIIEIVW